MRATPLEKTHRTRLRRALVKHGCRYLRTNFGGPFTGATGAPDLEGCALDGRFFAVELKRQDRHPWESLTEKQKAHLVAIQRSGGRACSLRFGLESPRGRLLDVWVPGENKQYSIDVSLDDFCTMILVGGNDKGLMWPKHVQGAAYV